MNETNTTIRLYKIYSARIAHALVKRGFPIIKKEPNMRFPQFDVFIFEDTPDFQKAMWEVRKAQEV